MPILNIEIDLDNWVPDSKDDYGDSRNDGETLNEFIKSEVIHYVGSRVYTAIDSEVMESVKKTAVTQAEIMVEEKIHKIAKRGIKFGPNRQKHTLESLVRDAIYAWKDEEPRNDRSWSKSGIKGLKRIMQETILKQLTKEFENVLVEVKNNAIREAQANIAQMLSVQLFDGTSLMKQQPPLQRINKD